MGDTEREKKKRKVSVPTEQRVLLSPSTVTKPSQAGTLHTSLATVPASCAEEGTEVRHYYGLENQGATCYINSVVQILFMTTEIHDRLEPKAFGTDHELKKLFEELEKETCGTEQITKIFGITNVHQQWDAAFCLRKILQKVSRKVSEVFQGQLNDTTTCSKGHVIIDDKNSFLILPLCLKDGNEKNYNVECGFEEIFQEKIFSGDEMVYCDKCHKKTEATSKYEMLEFPQILVLLLKRFDLDYRTMKYVKSDRCVEVPGSLQKENTTYKLYGMVNHMGGLAGGHYTATIRSKEDQTWYEFNDSRVSKAEEQPFENAETLGSTTAYLLVYRREDLDELREHTEEHQTDNSSDSPKTKRPKEQKQLAKEGMKKRCSNDEENRLEEQKQAVQEQVSEHGKKEECRREVRNNRVHQKDRSKDWKGNKAEGEPLFKNQDQGRSEKQVDNKRKVENRRHHSMKKEKDNRRSTHPLKDPISLAIILSIFLVIMILILIVAFSI